MPSNETARQCSHCGYKVLKYDLVLLNGKPHHIDCMTLVLKERLMNETDAQINARETDQVSDEG